MTKAVGGALFASILFFGASAAVAADLRPVMKAAPAPVAVPVYNWTGFYAGINAGAIWGRARTDAYNGPLYPPFLTIPPGGIPTIILGLNDTLPGSSATNLSWLAGGQVGYNWQSGSFLIGVEADAVATGLRMSGTTSATRFPGTTFVQTVSATHTTDIDWMGSLRLRLGLVSDRTLFYVTGGAAVADIDIATLSTVTFGPGINIPVAGAYSATSSASQIRLGWTIGGGIEWAFNNNWSVAGEYRYSDFGRVGSNFAIPDGLGTTFATASTSTRVTTSQATLRLNYRFAPGPVVARY